MENEFCLIALFHVCASPPFLSLSLLYLYANSTLMRQKVSRRCCLCNLNVEMNIVIWFTVLVFRYTFTLPRQVAYCMLCPLAHDILPTKFSCQYFVGRFIPTFYSFFSPIVLLLLLLDFLSIRLVDSLHLFTHFSLIFPFVHSFIVHFFHSSAHSFCFSSLEISIILFSSDYFFLAFWWIFISFNSLLLVNVLHVFHPFSTKFFLSVFSITEFFQFLQSIFHSIPFHWSRAKYPKIIHKLNDKGKK